MKKILLPFLLLLLGALIACNPTPNAAVPVADESSDMEESHAEDGDAHSGEMETLTLVTYDSFLISEAVIEQFEADNHVDVVIVPAGDAGQMLNQAILANESGEPLGDVLFGLDNTFMGRALSADIFESFTSANIDTVSAEFKLDNSGHLTPVQYGDVCLNYDIGWFADSDLTPPNSLADLADPAYQDLFVTMNPATSSPGLAFLLTTIAEYGEEGHLDYWQSLMDNGALIVDGWSDAYWGHFTGASDGDRPIVVSYASSPPAEVFYSEGAYTEPPTAAVTADGTCFRSVEFAGILKGSAHADLGGKLIDFMLSESFQEDIPLNMFVFPANDNATLPQLFVDFATVSDSPALIAPDVIDAHREEWIETWSDSVLR